jgi:hypothetical protein
MDAEMRKAVEERAHALWDEAGRPDGSSLLYWLRAEQEFGIIPKGEHDDPLVTIQELAAEAQALEESEAAPADEALQESVDKAVPRAERLPGGADENPISQHIESIAQGQAPMPGATTVEPARPRPTARRPGSRSTAPGMQSRDRRAPRQRAQRRPSLPSHP